MEFPNFENKYVCVGVFGNFLRFFLKKIDNFSQYVGALSKIVVLVKGFGPGVIYTNVTTFCKLAFLLVSVRQVHGQRNS